MGEVVKHWVKVGGRGVAHLCLALPLLVQAGLSLEERAPLVEPRAAKLRQLLLQQRRGPAEIESESQRALQAAERLWQAGQADEALLALSPLQKYAPIAELPFVRVQLLMAALAQHQHNQELRNHHRAWALALVKAIGRSGDGRSPATAFRLVQASEAEAWLLSQQERYKPLGQRRVSEGARTFDVWRVATPNGGQQELYFDISAALARPVRPGAAKAAPVNAKTRTSTLQKNQAPAS